MLQSEINRLESEVDQSVAELVSIAEEGAERGESYETMWRRWENAQDTFPLEELTSMVICVQGFPASVIGLTRCPDWRTNRAIGIALDALNSARVRMPNSGPARKRTQAKRRGNRGRWRALP